jgi:hypothetical protein
MRPTRSTSSPRGQTLVIVALGLAALIGMVGVVIDVGLQWAANRGSQNATDAMAEAGAVVILQQLTGADPPKTDADVLDAVETAADLGEVELEGAEYTDWHGNSLDVQVGSGGAIPLTAQGVRAVGTRVHETVFAQIVGIRELNVRTDATAVTGPIDKPCPATGPCALLPVTVPNTIVTCDGQNKSVTTTLPWVGPPDAPEYIVPLCGDNPGSVGWIDWTPPPGSGGGGGGGGGGGSDELAEEICDPNPPSDLDLPNWYYVTSAGNTNSSNVQECFEKWIGTPILFPLFDDTCATDPGSNQPCTDPAPIGGINQWYHFPSYASFMLTGVYISGNNADVCDTGNGATTCITGRFVDTSLTGTVGQHIPTTGPQPPSQFFAVQLID